MSTITEADLPPINWPAISERVEAAITKQRLSNLCAGLRDAAIGCESFARGEHGAEPRCAAPSVYEQFGAKACQNVMPCANHGDPWRPGHALKGKL